MFRNALFMKAMLSSLIITALLRQTTAETLRIIVRDENNSGVQSQVFVYKSAATTPDNQVLFGETDDHGVYVANHKCEQPQVIIAHPKNSGVYFYSSLKPCKQQLLIPVIHRFASLGRAFNGAVTDVTFEDGTLGVVATWAYLGTTKSEKKSATAGVTCDVNVQTKLDNTVFRLEGDKLKVIAKGYTPPSQTLFPGISDDYSAVFPTSCDDAKGKILTLENSSASYVDAAFGAHKLSGASVVKMLQGKM